ncbi:hypothetical protein [Hamadaea tsunoensis]|uniref:hypothetical protein n=1 Tax=Hamadaea tsunoensis TaxID=53368 RepID=UPI00042645F8|nr:hypothetical protein [Hamadaea tsunoensis]
MTPRLIGGEMLVWSDLDGTHGPGPVRGSFAPFLRSGRTLIAGPHDTSIIDAVPGDVTILVRGISDAETLAARHPGATILCGALEKLSEPAAFDTVIALDGVGRLNSVEGAELSWAEALNVLLATLRPDGRLVLGFDNQLGLHRLTALPGEPSDAEWLVSDAHDRSRPAGLARVSAALGRPVARTYAVFPGPIAPTALLSTELLADESRTGYVDAVLSRAMAPAAPVLSDPVRLAHEAVRHGAAAELAPAWIFVTGPAGGLPDALVDGEPVDRSELPGGRTLEDLLLEAALKRDLPAVRELLGQWRDRAAGVPADQLVDFAPLAEAGEHAAALRAFAATVLDGGYAHPWPSPAGVDDLARMLAAMTGDTIEFSGPAPAGPSATAFRELTAERDRLATELAEAHAKFEYYEQRLTARENSLNRALRIIDLLSAKGPARAGRALMGGARAARRTVRTITRTIRPR